MTTKELIKAVKNERGSAFQNCRECEYGTHNGEVIEKLDRLAELEDKIEQGKLIELPCKVGDTMYYVLDYGSVKGECVCVEKGKVRAIEMRENYIWIEVLYDDFVSKHPLRNIGETVFLTREEVEKKLKELQEKEK